MIGRNTCDAELERDLATKPFETYELFRGQKFGADGDGGDYREVGKFKVCFVCRVCASVCFLLCLCACVFVR